MYSYEAKQGRDTDSSEANEDINVHTSLADVKKVLRNYEVQKTCVSKTVLKQLNPYYEYWVKALDQQKQFNNSSSLKRSWHLEDLLELQWRVLGKFHVGVHKLVIN